ncbi:MAG: helix-turn-helix domain-containing protein [Gemmatimonadaceae bacterium]|jgi:hypothetical protein
MFNKPVGSLTTQDLEELLVSAPLESVRLEFKSAAPGPDELVKKLSGFANTFGGYLIVGAAENAGRLAALPGIEPRPDYRQTITQQCASGIVPLIDVFISDPIPTPADDGKVCYVIFVPESDRTPHFVSGRKGAYVRVDEHSHRVADKLATYEEILQLSNRRQRLIEQRDSLIRRASARFSQFSTMNTPREDGKQRASAMIAVVPRYPSKQLLDHPSLLKLAREVRVPWRSVEFPQERTPLSQHESALLPTEYEGGRTLVEVNSWGLVTSTWTIEQEIGYQSTIIGIHLRYLLGMVLVLLEYAKKIHSRMGFEGPLRIVCSLDRIRGVPLYGFHYNFPNRISESRFDDEMIFSVDAGTDDLATRRDTVAAQVVQSMLFALGWTGPHQPEEIEEHIAALLRGAYEYNSWPQPASS